MRKYILSFILTSLIGYVNFASACDQVFDGGMLRYNHGYRFYDVWYNNENVNVYLNRYRVDFVNPNYLDKGSDFGWTQELKNNGYRVNPNSNMRVLETGPIGRRISLHPNTRTSGTRYSYDFGIKYTIAYDYSNNYPDASDDRSHTECVYYSVSWCGDGVLDSGYEECDNGASNGTPGNPCDRECRMIREPNPTCNSLTVSPTSGTAPLTSSFSCSSNSSQYKIEIRNITSGANTLIHTFVNTGGTYTFRSSGTYVAQCYVGPNDVTDANNCKRIITVSNPPTPPTGFCGDGILDPTDEECDNGTLNGTPGNSCSQECRIIRGEEGGGGGGGGGGNDGGGGGGGGGAGVPVCNSLTVSPTSGTAPLTSSFSCSSNSNQYTIDIRNITSGANTLIHTFVNTGGTYTFRSSGTYVAQCYVGPNNVTDTNNCKRVITVSQAFLPPTTSQTGFCGDGILQRPNGFGVLEECDFGLNPWPSWCGKNDCRIIEDTRPGGGGISISPSGDILLGHGMSVFGNLSSSNISIKNNSTSDVYINKRICVYKRNISYDVVDGNDICSSSIVGRLNKLDGIKQFYIPSTQFIANASRIPTGIDYGEAQTTITLEGLQDVDTFLKSILNVRVAKPSVSTLGGGASLLNGTNFSDLKNLSRDGFALLNPSINRNLILSSIGVNPLSSYVKSTSNPNIITISKQEGDKELNRFNNVNSNLGNITITSLPSNKFNGFDNVFIHKGNVELNTQTIPGGNKTYVIENGDLTINGNIISSGNILFVVKNGNINIKNNTSRIDAILISIGGSIRGEKTSTLNRLVINGALYGDVNDLLSKRTYIKNRGEYIDVGTNVNFTSKVFSSPPPLLSQFLWEYLEGKKVPK